MNSTHEFRREYMPVQPPRMAPGPSTRPGIRVTKTSVEYSEDSDSSWSSSEDDELPNPASLTLASDSSLCIPSLNHVEWETFQAAGKTRELFRNSNFHAIDVLEGEPQIVFSIDDNTRGRARFLARKTAHANSGKQSANIQQEQKKMIVPESEVALPERIRINSPAIVKAFSEIHEEEFSGSFLMFKPFASLLYYEQDFRDWVAHREETIRDTSSSRIRIGPPDIDDEAERIVDSVALQEMLCLFSFIDNHIKKRSQYLTESLCKAVSFSDLPLLFNPGDTVIEPDEKQAYRVVGVTATRHRVKKPNEDEADFWKDFSQAEYADNPVLIHCVHVDFDGLSLGPVQTTFRISRFEGQKDVLSLPVYPFRYARDGDLRGKLIERGRTFLKLAAIKHMHHTGSTMGTREELDSQVVIDFDEAISRHPEWKPELRPTTSGFHPESDKSTDSKSGADKSDRAPGKRKTKKPKIMKCVKECCRAERSHDEEYVGERRAQEYVASHMGGSASTSVSVTMIIRPLKDLNGHDCLTDDDLLVVSYRVFGFALRSRKWYKLDMTYLSEVNVLGDGEGFDQLVLPEGHGDLVKSMIRQHFRDKKLSAGKGDSSDIVRGKGRGLIMLLHGVPGVGKTSTAADLFRRPLFQITSGDLGLSAKEVEDTLNDNFNLASRWDSVLLIDEADVFLGERTKEDFVRNSLVAVFLRMMEYYSGVLFLTTNRVGVFDEAFTSRIHISLYYPPLDRESTRKIFEKNGERIQARYKSDGRLLDIRVSEITDFALDYFDNNKEGRWNGRQIRNAFQSAVALAELDASGTDDIFSEVDHGQPVVLGKKSFDTVAHVYKSFLAYLKQVYGADYARRARENLWRFDAFGAPRIPNALTTRLAMADPAPPPRGPEPPRTGQSQQPSWYDYREPSHPYAPPQNYPDRYSYDYPSQRPRGGPPPEQQHQRYRETPRSMGSHPSAYHPPPTRTDDPRSEGYRDDRGFSQPSPHPEWVGRGGGEAGSEGYPAPTRHDPQHSQAHYPSDSGHLSPFQGNDR
ncbi:hypothetical protein BJ166DRAFT_63490 [Pestalotiopsis sp. NC0098]|nr:hypothetical protein BJ166DRAFT_63490 [Pestalotiopsis sp. NC0098]